MGYFLLPMSDTQLSHHATQVGCKATELQVTEMRGSDVKLDCLRFTCESGMFLGLNAVECGNS